MAYPRRVKQRSRITSVTCAALIGLTVALGPAASASPTSPASADYPQVGDQAASEEFVEDSTAFRSCKKMRKYYPRGIAKSSAARDRARAKGFGPAEVKTRVYKANRKLDAKGIRVACEVSAARARKEFRAELLQKQMPTAEAGEYTESAGYLWRVGSYDGVPQAVTMDYNMDRLTFDVNDGIVTDAAWG